MRFFRVGFALFLAATMSQCALEHPATRGDATDDATDMGPTDTPDVSDVSEVEVDAGPCGAATQRCCTAPASGGRDAGLDGGGPRSCNPGLACAGGVCNPCGMGSAECNGACVPINTPQNCGTCGNVCPAGQGCILPGDASVPRCEIICPSGQVNCGGTCVSTVMDPANCGTCGNRCQFANATSVCSSGMCALGSCLSGFENCNTTASDGCEANVRTSATNCGTCGTACVFPHGAATCERGVCTLGTCEMGFGDCDGNAANGCETNLTSSPNHCNRCGLVCPTMGGAPACRAGVCGTSTCAVGRGDCDSNSVNGCETDLLTTPTNCGTCGNSCSFPNASPTCVAGACALGACATGFANCDGMAANGCETNLRTDVNHCGMCPTVCTFANGAASCASGVCALTSCSSGFANCDSNAINGCEVDTRTSVSHCGACTNACTFTRGVAACTGSACALASCEPGFGNCDGNAMNGCETNTQTTVAHCGACGRTCTLANATAGCSLGACTVASCNAGFGNCDGNAMNGCETNTNTTVAQCGTCGNACSLPNATPTCTAGVCRILSCNTNFFDCDMNPANGCEVDLRTTSNCGSCGRACMTLEVCNLGTCQLICPGTQTACSGSCVFTDRDTSHCGGCGRACSSTGGTPSCASGACSIACNTGFGNCNGMVSDGCEASLRTLTNCGTCGTACARANASASCASGACVLGACNSGFADCDGIESNGCETALRTLSNCSRCGDVCSTNQATAVCTSGATPACDLTCATGFFDCNSSASDGCEVSLRTLTSCGGCTTTCARTNATPTCSTGSCRISTCNTNFGDCDTTDANGCEVNLLTTAAHCGVCGRACLTPTGTSSNTCASGVCSPTCATGFATCDSNPVNGCEIDTRVNSSNCGACGTICQVNANTSANSCSGSVCRPTCVAGFADCDSNPVNGCEANLSSGSTCGACGTVCASGFSCTGSVGSYTCTSVCGAVGQTCCSGATCRDGAGCSSGLCCLAPTVNCGGTCVNTASSNSNCGSCGTTCATNAGTSANTCTSSVCVPTCITNFGNCDGNPTNGCETDLRTSGTNCGACGTVCMSPAPGTSSTSCVSQACAPVCATLYGDCDSSRSNGCETQLNSNTNCNACGAACSTGNTCIASGGTASCVACGTANLVCCGPSSTCGAGTSCLASTGGAGSSLCCTTGLTNCSGACVPLTNNSNCGACGTACASGTTCITSGTSSCVACGAMDQPCCAAPAATECGSGLICTSGVCTT